MRLLHGQIRIKFGIKCPFDLVPHHSNVLAVMLGYQLVLVVLEVLKFLVKHT